MNTTTTTTSTSGAPVEYRGYLIAGTTMRQITVPARETWKAIQASIGAHTFDVVGCRDGIDLYVDDEALINRSPFNLPLTIIAHTLGAPWRYSVMLSRSAATRTATPGPCPMSRCR